MSAVYTVITPRAAYFFVYNCYKRNIYLSCCCFWLSKHRPCLFSYFETSKYVRRYLVCQFVSSKYVILALLSSAALIVFHFNIAYAKNTYTLLCLFVDRANKCHYYLSVSTFTSKNLTGTLLVFCLSLTMDSLPFSRILTRKYINRRYLVAVYALNIPTTPSFFVYSRLKRNVYHSCCLFTFRTSIVPFLLLGKM